MVLVVVAALGVRWWTHPTVFGGLGDGYRADPRPVERAAMSTTVIFPKVGGDPETVTIDDLRAVFTANTADAAATFGVCHMSAGEDPIGAVHDPADTCADSEAFEKGMTLRHGVAPDSDYLFVTITPTRAGVAHLVRVEVTYHRDATHLWQRGTESIRVDRQITAE